MTKRGHVDGRIRRVTRCGFALGFFLLGCGQSRTTAMPVSSVTPAIPTPQPIIPSVIAAPLQTATLRPRVAPDPDIGWQSDWLHNVPCAVPCFLGITPGTTTVADAVAILRDNPLIDPASIRLRDDSEIAMVSSSWATGAYGVSLFSTLGVTTTVVVGGISPMVPAVPLRTILDAFGDPSDIAAVQVRVMGEGDPPAMLTLYQVHLIYRHHGLILSVLSEGYGKKPVLSPRLMLSSPILVAPGDGVPTSPFAAWLIPPAAVQPWQGMQSFDVYCRTEDGAACD